MMSLAVWPIVFLALLGVAAIVGLLVAMIVKSPKRKLLVILPVVAVFGLVLMAGVLAVIRTSVVQQEVAAQQLQLEREEAAVRAVGDEYEHAIRSQVLDYRGDSSDPVVTDAVTTGDSSTIEVFRYSPTEQQADEPLPELPSWVRAEREMDPRLADQSFVLASEPWSSVEEADEELYALLSVHLGEYVHAVHPETEGWQPARTAIEDMPLIQDAVRETVPLEVGEHTVHLQQAYWQIQLTPDVREDLLDQWRPVIVRERLMRLGAGVGVLTLVFAVSAGVFRLRRRPQGGARHGSAVAAAVMLLMCGLSMLFLS